MRRRGTAERGSAAVLVAAACAALIALGAAAALVGAAAHASARARAAADLSALAGATTRMQELFGESGTDPCTVAARVAVRNGSVLTACAVDDGVNVAVTVAVTVSVPVSVPGLGRARSFGGVSEAVASARAGPAPPRPSALYPADPATPGVRIG